MTVDLDRLRADLIRDEGLRLRAYRDTTGVWSIGVGHAGRGVRAGLHWTRAQAMAALDADIADAIQYCQTFDCWPSVAAHEVRARVLANMVFNLGPTRFRGFRRMIAALGRQDWAAAAAEMRASKWAGQVGARAERLAAMMESGHDTILG